MVSVPYDWVLEITSLLNDPANKDQDPQRKTKGLLSAKEGKTHLVASGMSNPKIKLLVDSFYDEHRTLSFTELLDGLDYLYHSTPFVEGHVFIMYALEKYRRIIDPNVLFMKIRDSWVPKIDY